MFTLFDSLTIFQKSIYSSLDFCSKVMSPDNLPNFERNIDRLIKGNTNPARLDTYFGLLAERATTPSLDLLISYFEPSSDRRHFKAYEAFRAIPADMLVLPLSKRLIPEVMVGVPGNINRASEIEEGKRAELLSVIIPESMRLYTSLEDQAEHGTEREVAQRERFLADTLARRSLVLACELTSQADKMVPVVSEALLQMGGLAQEEDQLKREAVERLLVAGGNEAIPYIISLGRIKFPAGLGNPARLLWQIDSEQAWQVISGHRAEFGISGIPYNEVAQKGDDGLKDKIIEDLASMSGPRGGDEELAETIKILESGDPEKYKNLMPGLIKLTRRGVNYPKTVESAVGALEHFDSIGMEGAGEAAYEGFKRTGLGVEAMTRLAKRDREMVIKLIGEESLGISLHPGVKEILESLGELQLNGIIKDAIRTQARLGSSVPRMLAYLPAEMNLDGCLDVMRGGMDNDESGNLAKGIARFGNEDTLQILLTALTEGSFLAKLNVATAIAEVPFEKMDMMTEEEAVALEKVTGGQFKTARQRAVASLVVAVMTNGVADIRKRVLYSLGKIGDADVAEAIAVKLGDDDPEVGYAAAAAIKEIHKRVNGL